MSGFESAVLEIDTGVLSDADTIVSVEIFEGSKSDGSDKTDVAAKDLQIDSRMLAVPAGNAQAAFDFSNDSIAFKIGYKGVKQYVGYIITPANNTGNIPIAVTWVLGNPRVSPPSAS
jgi:hypothetical protein